MKCFFLAGLLLLTISQSLTAQGPRMIAYQGFLSDTTGVPTNGLHDITVSFTDSGGSVKWQETHPDVPVEDGLFDIIIGSVTPLTYDVILIAGDRLLISVDGQDLLPSSLIASVPFAMSADQFGGYFTHDFLRRNKAESTIDSTAISVLRVENKGAGRGMTIISTEAHALYGRSNSSFAAVEGEGAVSGPGLRGSSVANHGTIGYSSASDKAGVFGNSPSGTGVWGNSETNYGVHGYSAANYGVYGRTIAPNEWVPAVYGRSEGTGDGVYGWSQNRHGVFGVSHSATTGHAGVYGVNYGAGPAIYSDGRLHVASEGVFIAGGDLHAAGGAFTGDIAGDGAPFPRPAFDSGWIDVEPPATVPLGVSGHLPSAQYNRDNFVIDLMTRNSGYPSNQYVGNEVYFLVEGDNDITVEVTSGAPAWVTQIRLRIWYIR